MERPASSTPAPEFPFAALPPVNYPNAVFDLSDRELFLIAVIIYGLSSIFSVFLWKKGFRRHDWISYGIIALGFLFHTGALVLRGFSLSRCPVNNLYEAIMFMMWTMAGAYIVIGAWHRLRFIGAFASPILLAMGVFGLMLPPLDVRGAQPEFTNSLASLHAALILLSYGAFGVSSIAAVMYLSVENDLKFHKARAVLSMLPPIERLELVGGRMLVAGFILLTAGLAFSPFLMKETYGTYLKPDFKIIWSVFVWFLYAGLLTMRWWFLQRGRGFAWGTIGSFSFILLTFWGANLLSGVHHP